LIDSGSSSELNVELIFCGKYNGYGVAFWNYEKNVDDFIGKNIDQNIFSFKNNNTIVSRHFYGATQEFHFSKELFYEQERKQLCFQTTVKLRCKHAYTRGP